MKLTPRQRASSMALRALRANSGASNVHPCGDNSVMDGSLLRMQESSTAPWFVAVTVPRAERIAREQYKRLGVDVFLPLREMPPTSASPLVVEPVWPGYLFVREAIIPTAERLFRTAPHQLPARTLAAAVRGIVSAMGEPVEVPRGFVEGLIAKADADGLIEKYEPVPARAFTKGDVVQILYGAHAGAFMPIEKVRGARLELKGYCFGREVPVEVKVEQVALAEIAA